MVRCSCLRRKRNDSNSDEPLPRSFWLLRLIRERLKDESVTPDEIDDLAVDFNVSAHVIEHQIENHRLAQLAV